MPYSNLETGPYRSCCGYSWWTAIFLKENTKIMEIILNIKN
jgi:hypothetical protein